MHSIPQPQLFISCKSLRRFFTYLVFYQWRLFLSKWRHSCLLQTCWNCGRKATETCSGCNVACYCGSFCQHRDWVSHQLVCRRSSSARGRSSPTTVIRSPPTPKQDNGATYDRLKKRNFDAPKESSKTGSCSPLSTFNNNDDYDNDDDADLADNVKRENMWTKW